MSNELTNEYGFKVTNTDRPGNELLQIEQARAIHEAQAPYVIAQKFPRDENVAFANIIKACQRPFLAEEALYSYPKGKTVVMDASIRLAEVIAQNWKHMRSGVIEISRSNGISTAKAFAEDRQHNTSDEKIFHVPHTIDLKDGKKKLLTSDRDIYELVANMGARRKRACILAIIPGDVLHAAIEEVKKTLSSGKEPIADRIRKLVLAFEREFGVSVDHLEKRLGHKLSATIEPEIITLRGIFKSLSDGMAKREDFFDFGAQHQANSATDRLKNLTEPKPPHINHETGEVTIKTETATSGDSNNFTFDQIKNSITLATTEDALHLAADTIRSLNAPVLEEELHALYKRRLIIFKPE